MPVKVSSVEISCQLHINYMIICSQG